MSANYATAAVSDAVKQGVRQWSGHQVDFFDWAEYGTGNVLLIAVAGSGKTTTGVEAAKRMRGSHIYLAFNRPVADELVTRGVNGRTFHSLCYGPVLRYFGLTKDDVKGNKLHLLLREHFDESVQRMYGSFMTRMVGLARNAGIGAGLVENVASEWLELAAHHDLEPDSDKADINEGVRLAMELLAISTDECRVMIDYDDMLYMVVKNNISLPKFDNVLVDEAQDTNAIQRAIIRKIMFPHTRLAAIGDPAQAIYGFRGADSDSMALLAAEFGCKEMPLTVTYRCPRKVVEFAQQWVDHIQAAPNASDGAVTDMGMDWNNKAFTPGNLVVCRTTKSLVKLAYRLIRDRVPARIMGKEIGEGLYKLVQKMNARGIDALVEKLREYTAREVKKAKDKDDAAKAESIQDKTDCVLCIIDGLSETNRTIPALKTAIEQLFSDFKNTGVTLATIHKAKGLEAERVFWLNSSKCPSPWARQDWQLQQEENLCYVAATRAKSELVLIEEQEGR